jgi:hypothetical protein
MERRRHEAGFVFRTRFMRPRLALLAALAALVPLAGCLSLGGSSSSEPFFTSALPAQPGTFSVAEAVRMISQYRAAHGLKPVSVDPVLTKIASVHAERMAKMDTMSHVLPGEGSFQQRLIDGGFRASMAAENVAAGQPTLPVVLEAWRKSPGHNANLLLPNVSKIGIALSIAEHSKYKYYWSLVLGEPYAGPDRGGPDAGPFVPPGSIGLSIGGQ